MGALWRQLGHSEPVEGLAAVIAGVAAAPADLDPDRWLDLLNVPHDGELATRLRRLRDRAAIGDPGAAGDRAGRLAALRLELGRRQLAGFVVPRADEHQGEYVSARAQRLAWLTGFTGSAGLAFVLRDRAAIFVDGRYTLQVRAEAPAELFEFRHLVDEPHAEWLTAALPRGGRIGYDPWLHTADWVEKARTAIGPAGIDLIACEHNPIDQIWGDQPPPPLAPVVPHDLRFAGRSSADKCTELAQTLAARGVAAAVLTQPDSIAWLLNIRGGDVPHTPVPLAFAIALADGSVDLFVDRRKLLPATLAGFAGQVRVHPGEALGAALDGFGSSGARVLLDPTASAAWIFDRLHLAGALIVREADPCLLVKARKNPVELDGIRSAHRRDGIALVRFLRWLESQPPGGGLTEGEAAGRLLGLRREGDLFRDTSFETIAASGPNAAVVHYRVGPDGGRRLERGELFLLDSGAQYLDGTTDVTRTVAIGEPSAEMREHFTLVLKGHIALATVRFPQGTTGTHLDSLARRPLWQAGLDYDHGTGHGVGSYLSVHEGPQRISKMHNPVALQPGMILSNEPGYYKSGAYGIRIENLVAVEACREFSAPVRPMLSFETLTLVPIDRRLIVAERLDRAERDWLDDYHARVRRILTPRLDRATAAWLDQATRPLGS
ncbi:MAG: M24 family metallopeptidase [Azospirillum sp.]|nr:M24 family metallopeptidase [Azospirillum sp.]